MDAETFIRSYNSVVDGLVALTQAVDKDAALLGSLTLDDFNLFSNLVKELRWNREI